MRVISRRRATLLKLRRRKTSAKGGHADGLEDWRGRQEEDDDRGRTGRGGARPRDLQRRRPVRWKLDACTSSVGTTAGRDDNTGDSAGPDWSGTVLAAEGDFRASYPGGGEGYGIDGKSGSDTASG